MQKKKKTYRITKKNGIQYGLHYPYAIHELRSLKKIFKNQKFFNAERLARQCISLPIDPNLSIIDQKKIIKTLNSF